MHVINVSVSWSSKHGTQIPSALKTSGSKMTTELDKPMQVDVEGTKVTVRKGNDVITTGGK